MRAATLIEFISVIFYLVIGISGAVYGGEHYGFFGAILGFFAPIVAVTAVFLFLGYLETWVWVGRPSIPQCEEGKCEKGDYELTWISERQNAYRCKCGHLYDKCGRRFFKIDENENVTPYLVWKAFRGWRPDDQST